MKKPKVLWPIEDLEKYFSETKITESVIEMDPTYKIVNIPLFISTYLSIIKKHNGEKTYRPYYERLLKLKEYLLKASK